MAEDANYNLVEPFDIDNGELDGLTPQVCFVLGVEWAMIRQALEDGGPFTRTIHAENADRFLALCKRNGRKARVGWLHDDYEQWRQLTVEGHSPQKEESTYAS